MYEDMNDIALVREDSGQLVEQLSLLCNAMGLSDGETMCNSECMDLLENNGMHIQLLPID